MSDKKDFEKTLENFKLQQPSPLQIDRWQSALYARVQKRPWFYAAAGLAAGIVLGLFLSGNFFAPEVQFSATFVQSDVKNL